MKYKRSLFNRAIIQDDWHRLWPIEAAYSLMLMLIMGLELRREQIIRYTETELYTTKRFLANGAEAAPYYGTLVGVVLAVALFSYVMKAQSVNLMHALPVRRETQFASHTLVGIEFFTLGNVVTAFFLVLIEFIYNGVDISSTFIWFLIAECTCLFFFGLAVVAVMLTGWMIAVPCLFVGLNAFFIATTGLLQVIAGYFYYGFNGVVVPDVIKWLTPFYEMCTDYMPSYDYSGEISQCSFGEHAISTAMIYGAVGILLLVIAVVLYKARKSESAGDVIAFSKLEPIVTLVVSFIIGLGFGILVYDLVMVDTPRVLLLSILAIIGGVLSVVVCNMFEKKSVRVFNKKTTRDVMLTTAFLMIAMLCLQFDITGFQNRIPEQNVVQYVSVQSSHVDQEIKIDDQKFIADTIQLHQYFINRGEETEGRYYIYIDYQLTDGEKISRRYLYDTNDSEELVQQLESLYNGTAVKKASREEALKTNKEILGGTLNFWGMESSPASYKELDADEMYALKECLLKDNDIPETIYVQNYPVYFNGELTFVLEDGEILYITLYESDENTIAWLAGHGCETNLFSVCDWYGKAPVENIE